VSHADETPESPDMLDLVGIGFGPANLALAIALEEHNAAGAPGDRLRVAFLEKQSRFGWHRGMLIDDATMQVSFLKDLVTMRNPASDFSFVSYLHERGRLVDFVNFKTLYPLRVEFHDYLEWAAERMAPLVTYGRQVTDVRPVLTEGGEDGEDSGPVIRAFDVVAAEVGPDGPTGATTVRRARNVVVALGLGPNVPPGARLGPRVWHNLDLLSRVEALAAAPRPPRCLVVVGAGQSAAEAVEFLHRRFPTAQVCSVFARYGYTPADDTPFANRIFDPGAVDTYFDADAGVKRMLFDYHRNTNYSVVDQELIEELYRRMYQETVQGEPRLRMLNASRVTRVEEVGDTRVDVTVEHLPTGEEATLAADALVYATGYRPRDALGLLGQAGELCARDDEGLARVERDYRVVTTLPSEGAVYLQGGTEHAHGITSTLLSNVAVRAGEIVASLVGKGYSAPSSSPMPTAAPPAPTPVASGSPASRPLTAASAVAARTASS
jgi:L-ornithine N5-oxygenase